MMHEQVASPIVHAQRRDALCQTIMNEYRLNTPRLSSSAIAIELGRPAEYSAWVSTTSNAIGTGSSRPTAVANTTVPPPAVPRSMSSGHSVRRPPTPRNPATSISGTVLQRQRTELLLGGSLSFEQATERRPASSPASAPGI